MRFGDAEAMDNFICRLRSYAPPAARVDRVQAERAEKEEPCPSDFRIVESEAENHADLPLLPPDLPVCEECLAEMKKPGDGRYRYPFISCVNCGPRYSIMEAVPYDRAHITMRKFCHVPFLQKKSMHRWETGAAMHRPYPVMTAALSFTGGPGG